MATRLANVIHHLSVDDLRDYFRFRRINVDDDIDWQQDDADIRRKVFALIESLPETKRAEILVDAEAIDDLADDDGIRAMCDVAHDRDGLLQVLDEIESHHGRALWIFINDQDGFRRASMVRSADLQRRGRSWSGFKGPAGKTLDRSAEALTLLKQGCADAYRDVGGFNGRTEVEVFERLASWRDEEEPGSVAQVTIYVEDRPQSMLRFEDDGLQRQVTRPANPIHLTYSAVDGAIDVIAKGGLRVKKAIACLFARHLLGVVVEPGSMSIPEMDLSRLADEATLRVNTVGAIAKVELKMVRLRTFDPKFPFLTLELPGRSNHSIYEGSNQWLGTKRLAKRGTRIDRAELIFEFSPEPGHPKSTKVPVTLTYPNSCSVKDKGQRHRPAIEEFLERSGIYRPINPDDDDQIEAAE